jgi:hypothetical protein
LQRRDLRSVFTQPGPGAEVTSPVPAIKPKLHALASNLGKFLRALATPLPIKDWSLTTLMEKLIKIGPKVVSHARYVAFQIAGAQSRARTPHRRRRRDEAARVKNGQCRVANGRDCSSPRRGPRYNSDAAAPREGGDDEKRQLF